MLFWVTIAWPNIAFPASTPALEEEIWLEQAGILVQAARSAYADATQFNIDVRKSRTQLRKTMRQVQNTQLSTELRNLHSTMLLLDVLLKSAAACQTAGHIVCPPLLMAQLKTVLENNYANLDKVKKATNQAGLE